MKLFLHSGFPSRTLHSKNFQKKFNFSLWSKRVHHIVLSKWTFSTFNLIVHPLLCYNIGISEMTSLIINRHFLFCIGNGLGKNHRKTRRIQKMWEYIGTSIWEKVQQNCFHILTWIMRFKLNPDKVPSKIWPEKKIGYYIFYEEIISVS